MVGLYGKTYHLWQMDRGDKLPLGQLQLMTSFTEDAQLSGIKDALKDRNERFSVDCEKKKAKRSYITEPEIHGGKCCMLANGYRWGSDLLSADADHAWRKPKDAEE